MYNSANTIVENMKKSDGRELQAGPPNGARVTGISGGTSDVIVTFKSHQKDHFIANGCLSVAQSLG